MSSLISNSPIDLQPSQANQSTENQNQFQKHLNKDLNPEHQSVEQSVPLHQSKQNKHTQQYISIPTGRLSNQMLAVIRIISAEQFLSDAVFRFINFQNESIDWEPIFKLELCTGYRAAIQFAYAVWTDQLQPKSQIFEDALSMSPELQRACLKALGLRWGL